MQGVHPMAKAAPSGAAPASPGRIRLRSTLASRARRGTRKRPNVARPIAITRSPAIRSRPRRWCKIALLRDDAAKPMIVNIVEKPATKRSAAAIDRVRVPTDLPEEAASSPPT